MPLLPYILNAVYLLVLLIASPVLIYRAVRHGKYRDGWPEKLLGRLPSSANDENVIWFHAVSVGEVLQLETILPGIAESNPSSTILITTTTNTGLEIARQRFPQHRCCYFPLDFSWSVKTALKRVRPAMVVLVELELWPNFIRYASAVAPVAIVNGRMSDRSFRGYNRVRILIEPVLSRLTCVGTQTEAYAERMRSLGAKNVFVTGSVKFDRVQTDRSNTKTSELRELLGIDDGDLVLIAGSTQETEETLAVDTWCSLREDFPTLRLIVVPRHRERFESVASMIESRNVPLARRSQLTSANPASRDSAILLDTLGELSDCWGLADIAFVGGSFGDRGGQNMIEPAAFGAAVVVGPNTANFQSVVQTLAAAAGIRVVPRRDQFEAEVRRLLSDRELREITGENARRAVLRESGAAGRTVELLNSMITSTDSEARQVAA